MKCNGESEVETVDNKSMVHTRPFRFNNYEIGNIDAAGDKNSPRR